MRKHHHHQNHHHEAMGDFSQNLHVMHVHIRQMQMYLLISPDQRGLHAGMFSSKYPVSACWHAFGSPTGGLGVIVVFTVLAFAWSARVWRVGWWLARIWRADCSAIR